MVKAEAKDHGYLNILAKLDIEPTSFSNLNMMVFDWKSQILRARLAGPAAIYRIRVAYVPRPRYTMTSGQKSIVLILLGFFLLFFRQSFNHPSQPPTLLSASFSMS